MFSLFEEEMNLTSAENRPQAIWNKNECAPWSKPPLCLERTHVSCVRGNFELLRMEPQTFLLYSGLPKTSYHYYHLRVADENRKVNLCNLCHDFSYLNHCNSIASLEILANSIPTDNRELLGVIFLLSPVILPFDRDNIPFQLASQPKRFQFVLRADDKTSSHRWRWIIYFILG